MPRPGYVYLLANKPNGTLYPGVTSDLAHRIRRHRAGATPGFASRYGAGRLVWFERHEDVQDAIRREKQVKKWRREWKVDLVRTANPGWRDLGDEVMAMPGTPLAMPDVEPVSEDEARRVLGDGVLGERLRMDSRVRGNDGLRDGEGRGEAGRARSRRDDSVGEGARGGRASSLRSFLTVAVLALVLGACGEEPPASRLAGEGPEALVALAVEVDAPEEGDSLGAVRSTVQTDAAGGVWYDALAAPGRDPAMGLTASGRTALHGWRWWTDADSVALGPADRVRGIARPDIAVRSYMERDTSGFVAKILGQIQGERPARLSERVTLLDGAGDGQVALLVEVADSVGVVGFRPVRSERRAAGDYRVRDVGGTLAFAAAADVPTDTATVPAGPIWTAVATDGGAVRSTDAAEDVPEGGRDQAFRLGEITIETPGAVAVATGATAQAAAAAARRALAQGDARRQARSERLAAIAESVVFDTEDPTMDMAFRWAVLTLEALTVQDSARVSLLPGLPGAEPESYPSAAWTVGAFLDTGRWETARALLTTTGDAQLFDRRIDLLGRAPDLVRFGDDQDDVFSSADGTPLFLAAAGDYVRTTGDRGLVSGGPNFWFKTVFALRGIYEPDTRNGGATDSLGFLVARDRRGTWLEGDPEAGAVRRRGAVAEGQGALYRALGTATQFARIMGVSQRSSATWYADTSAVLLRQFERRFVRNGLVADRVDRSGASADLRPGGLLALAQLDGLPADERARLARAMAERLVFPYGVASLAQTDSLFHPYLDAPAFYTPESARTNGAVWTWLSGPVATLMAETGGAEPAAALVRAQAELLLDTGVVGAIPELVAGHPRTADAVPEVGGAPVQPWSIASFLEATIEGMVGARYASADTLVVAPRLPETWGTTTVRLRLGDGTVGLRLTGGADGVEAQVEPGGRLPEAATLVLEGGGRRVAVPLTQVQGDTLVTPLDPFEVTVAGAGAAVDGDEVASSAIAGPGDVWDGFAFAEPALRDEYPVMRAVENQRALGDGQILRDNPTASVTLTQTDPQGDDWGATSTFTYPEGVTPGALDATYLEIARDDSTTYFRAEFAALGDDPQTIVAFAIDTEEGGATTVGRGADYDFPDDGGYEYVVFVGDGLLVLDAAGREVGQLGSGTAFDPSTGSLQFALPTFIVPSLGRSRVTMLVGALEPDGGVGSFRRVEREASEDVGGGRVDIRSPNVYDVVVGGTR
ncbi:amylo-alpha-1,6-glucosidase [Rubrivirga sp.]|uniref:amylo-alpha-1,6-glucosidase n=1 Tax=Rubrivirga sp. TaxID=1885344 RepID=UPI003B52AA74